MRLLLPRLSLLACGLAAAAAAGEPTAAIVLPRPRFTYFHRAPSGPIRTGEAPSRVRLRLVQVSERRNQVTDEARWFRRNGLFLPDIQSEFAEPVPPALPDGVPSHLGTLVRAIYDAQQFLLIHGPDRTGGRYLTGIYHGAPETRYTFDFGSYLQPPRALPADREFVNEPLQWAQEVDGTLYVSNFHLTYAKSSGGANGYVTAIDLKDRKPRWRSRPLVCNSRNFVVYRDAVLCGYGFTGEPDFLYVLDRKTGAVVQQVKVRSGPEYILMKNGRVHVRTYDTDYVFRLTQ